MFSHNLRQEVKLMSRNRWLLSLILVLIVLCFYAGHNGLDHFSRRQAGQEKAVNAQSEKEERVFDVARALDNGNDHPSAFRLSPMNFSMAIGSLVTMPATQISILAIGQSDLYTHQLSISSRDDLATLSYNELNNPVQLLFGKFDLTFVIGYLIPLLIIAFTYNLRTEELESGRLKLLASNPVKINMWLLQRFFIRYFTLAAILTVVLMMVIWWVGIEVQNELLTFLLLTYGYLAFWFALSFLMNVLGYSSARNAVSLLSLWIVLVLLIPTIINQTASTIYPMPSRVTLLNEIRSTKKDLSEQQDKVLDEYLRNHPELIRNEGENAFSYWQGFYASQEMTEKALSGLIEKFDRQVIKQQKWVDQWGYLSPAVLFQAGATQLAGTSSVDYNRFKSEVKDFSLEWRNYFLPFVFDNKMLELNDLSDLPKFQHNASPNLKHVFIPLFVLIVFSMLMVIGGLLMERKKQLLPYA